MIADMANQDTFARKSVNIAVKKVRIEEILVILQDDAAFCRLRH